MNNPRNCGCQKWLTECNQREGCYSATRMKAMSDEQDLMRAFFEESMSSQGEWPKAIEKNADGGYRLMNTAASWEAWQDAWQAARQQAVPSGCVLVGRNLLERLLDEGSRRDTWAAQDELRAMLAAAPKAEQNPEFGAPYQGAREEMAIWKKRALEAEQRIREQDQIIDGLVDALNADNGPVRFGEPVFTQAEQAVAVDRKEIIEVLMSTTGLSAGVTADAILGLFAAAQQAEQAVEASKKDSILFHIAEILRKAQGMTCYETGDDIDVVYECMRIRELCKSAPPAPDVSRLVKAAHNALLEIESIMHEAYNSAEPVCCGRPGMECCGSPAPEWSDFDQRMMDRLAPHQRALNTALAAHQNREG